MIEWSTIDFKGKSNGEVNVLCPKCSHNRKPSNKKTPCLQVNMDKGVGKCYNCEDVTVKEPKKQEKIYTPPPGWENHTNISDGLVKWFKDDRKISQKTLIECKISEEEYYQPQHGKKCNNIVFNYFEGDVLVNKKYRSGAKKFTQCKNAKKVFYGINDIIGETTCYIVEGEMDKLAFWEAGIKNCISVPNGANDLNNVFETCAQYLIGIEKFYLALDNDEPGKKMEHELLKRFGKWKCERIEFKHGKDAGDELKKGKLELIEAIGSPVKYPVDGSFTAKDIESDIIDLYENGLSKTIKPKNERFEGLNQIFSLIPGQVTTITGVPSHGKSNFIEDYVVNLIADLKLTASFYSPEHYPLQMHQSVLCEKVMGKPFHYSYNNNGDHVPRITHEEIKEYIEWSKDKIHLIHPEKGATVDWAYLLDKFKEQMFSTGTDIFVIDAWNKVRRNNPDSLGEINQILSELTAFAQGYGVSVLLIAHPTKMKKREDGSVEMPDLYSVKGSGDFRDQSHNGLCVYRWFESNSPDGKDYVEVHNLKTKFKHQGEIGEMTEFMFDKACNRYYPKGSKPNRNCLFKNQEPQKSTAIVPDPDAWITEKVEDVEF